MRTLRALIALPFVLLGIAVQVLLLPALLLVIVWFIFGTGSTVFGLTVLVCCAWAYLEWHHLRGAPSHRGGGRRLSR